MERINMLNWKSAIINGKTRVAIPIMTHPGIELIGRTVYEAVTDGEVHHRAILALNEKYPAAATTVIMDLTVEAEAFGARIHFSQDEVPTVEQRLLASEADIEALPIPDITAGRVPEYLKANRLTAVAINDKPVLAGCIGPFSLAGRLYDMSEIMMLPYINPEAAALLLEKCTTFLIEYVRALKATGVSGVIIAEPAAGLLSNDDCFANSSVYIQKIVEALQDEYFAVILHNCGNAGHCTQAMTQVGAMGYHFGNAIDLPATAGIVPPTSLIMGNIDPVSMFKSGSPEEMKEAATGLLCAMASYPNFVLSSGCDTPPHVPFINIDAFYEALSDYNQL